jgi:hypothetical protein
MPVKLAERLRERVMARLWRRGGLGLLRCEDGRRFLVLYPGRPGVGPGPDFRDALLLEGSGDVLRGDVELHMRPQGWQQHGHHHDPRYNSVVLHVVMFPLVGQPSAGGPDGGTRLEMGASVPVLPLFPTVERLRRRRATRDGPAKEDGWPGVARVPPDRRLLLLEGAGEGRFRAKARALARPLTEGRGAARHGAWASQAEEALYRGLLEALGYGADRRPYMALGQLLPLAMLRRLLLGCPAERRSLSLVALLLGAAGLIEKVPDDLPVEEIASTWVFFDATPMMDRDVWRGFHGRPDNSPQRRLAGMALLLARHWEDGLLQGLQARVLTGHMAALRSGLAVPQGVLGSRRALIGVGRADEMAINVVLPFFYAWARHIGRPSLSHAALRLYRGWPALPPNEVLREAARVMGIPMGQSGCDATARRQQGLIHLYRLALAGARTFTL